MDNKAMQAIRERLLESFRDVPLVTQAIEGFLCTFCELVYPLIQSMADMEGEDND